MSHATIAAYANPPMARIGHEWSAAAPTAAAPATARFVTPVVALTASFRVLPSELSSESGISQNSEERRHVEIDVPNGIHAPFRGGAFRRLRDSVEDLRLDLGAIR